TPCKSDVFSRRAACSSLAKLDQAFARPLEPGLGVLGGNNTQPEDRSFRTQGKCSRSGALSPDGEQHALRSLWPPTDGPATDLQNRDWELPKSSQDCLARLQCDEVRRGY